jgi:hypothetical protein
LIGMFKDRSALDAPTFSLHTHLRLGPRVEQGIGHHPIGHAIARGNAEEIIRNDPRRRVLDASANRGDWQQGEDCIIVLAVSDEEAKTKFPSG